MEARFEDEVDLDPLILSSLERKHVYKDELEKGIQEAEASLNSLQNKINQNSKMDRLVRNNPNCFFF